MLLIIYFCGTHVTAIDQENPDILIAPDESTIKRWQAWFKLNMMQIVMALISVAVEIEDKTKVSTLANPKTYLNRPPKNEKRNSWKKVRWLNETVRILVNTAKGISFSCCRLLDRCCR